MSQYLILIRTCEPSVTTVNGTVWRHALTTTSHPPTGLSLLQNYCPLKLETIHTVRAASQTDTLLKTLQIKYRTRLLHSFWYAFTPEEVSEIKAINEQNFSSTTGFLQRRLQKPEMSPEEAQRFITNQIELARTLTQK